MKRCVDHAAGVGRGPLVQSVVHADGRQRQQRLDDGQERHDVGDRAFRHEAAEQEQAQQRQAAGSASELGQRTAGRSPARRSIHQVTPGPGLSSVAARNTKITSAVPTSVARACGSSSRTSRHIRNTTMHDGAGEDDLLVERHLGQPHRDRERGERQSAAQDPPVDLRSSPRSPCSMAVDLRRGSVRVRARRRAWRRRRKLASSTSRHGNDRDDQRQLVDLHVDRDLLRGGHRCRRRWNITTLTSDTSNAPPMMATRPSVCMVVWPRRRSSSDSGVALRVHPRHRLDGHGIGHARPAARNRPARAARTRRTRPRPA